MTPNQNCVLGEQHCAALDKALTVAAQARDLAQKCVDCGLPMEDVVNELKQREKLAMNLKRQFFPNRV